MSINCPQLHISVKDFIDLMQPEDFDIVDSYLAK